MTSPAYGPEWSASLRRGPDSELDAWLAFALELADAADALAAAGFRRDMVISTKPDRSFVTETDQAIERLCRERIAARYPDHGLVGEEYGIEAGAAATRWYIDPIDGTHNFIRGILLFGLLLAVERDGEIQAGVVSAPALGERWYARRGGGAWACRTGPGRDLTPRPIAVSGISALGNAQILYGSARDLRESGRAPGFDALLRASWRDRGFGDFWGYALVAEGAAEAMIEGDLHSWDLAAPTVIVEEAGGRVTDLSGVRSIQTGSCLATNGLMHDDLLRRLAGQAEPLARPPEG